MKQKTFTYLFSFVAVSLFLFSESGFAQFSSVDPVTGQAIQQSGIDPMESIQQTVNNNQAEALGQIAGSLQACESRRKYAKYACAGQTYAPIIAMILPGLADGGSGSVKESCEKAAKYAKNGTLLNAAVIASCQGLRYSCENTCDEVIQNPQAQADQKKLAQAAKKSCSEMQFEVMTMILSLGQAVQALSSSKSCSDIASDDDMFKCSQNKEAMRDPKQCPIVACNVTQYPENRNHEACNSLNQDQLAQLCQGAQASYNPLCIAYCAANPKACTGTDGDGNDYANNPYQNGDSANGIGLDGLDDNFNLEDEITGGTPAPNNGIAKGSPSGGGGGLGGSSGNAAAGAGGVGAPAGQGGFDTDVIGKASGGSGGGTTSGGGGYESAGGAWKRSGGTPAEDKMKEFDLSKFLPGKAKDPKRDPANAKIQLQNMGITQANGLSNFQKVTRMINKKRSDLTP